MLNYIFKIFDDNRCFHNVKMLYQQAFQHIPYYFKKIFPMKVLLPQRTSENIGDK